MRDKTCKSCGKTFTPGKPLQIVCSARCAFAYTMEHLAHKRAKAIKLERKTGLLRLMTRTQQLQKTQKAFNRWIRSRDAGKSCISCGTLTGQFHAGHYRSTKAAPELRFHPDNCHGQCAQCNTYLSGNLIEYRKGLHVRIGTRALLALEGPHPPAKYTVEELREMEKRYLSKARELEKSSV